MAVVPRPGTRRRVARSVPGGKLDAIPAHDRSHDAGRQDGAGRSARPAQRRQAAGGVAQRQLPGHERSARLLPAPRPRIPVTREARPCLPLFGARGGPRGMAARSWTSSSRAPIPTPR
ncbi:hypothetical protein G6F61_014655 [Rhizopus arrhizus]|nr:hypothetical protein G6F61_014655 [Rhizopus arrhizus]